MVGGLRPSWSDANGLFMRHLIVVAFVALAFSAASCADPRERGLNPAERTACRASGGYESVSAFGFPICQIDYADAGNVCSSASDCTGRCLAEAPTEPLVGRIGTEAEGRCEPRRYTPGCHALVENGKLATPYICDD